MWSSTLKSHCDLTFHAYQSRTFCCESSKYGICCECRKNLNICFKRKLIWINSACEEVQWNVLPCFWANKYLHILDLSRCLDGDEVDLCFNMLKSCISKSNIVPRYTSLQLVMIAPQGNVGTTIAGNQETEHLCGVKKTFPVLHRGAVSSVAARAFRLRILGGLTCEASPLLLILVGVVSGRRWWWAKCILSHHLIDWSYMILFYYFYFTVL